jgi:hypothetical protein
VFLVIHFNNTPRICTASDLAAIRSVDNLVGPNDSKWNFAGNLFCLGNRLLVFVLVCGGLEDVDIVVVNIRQDLEEVRNRAKTNGVTSSPVL